MKIRNGFVSNSSSSSFIATYGMVVNEEQFNAWKSSHEIGDEYKMLTGEELWKKYNDQYDYDLRGHDFFDHVDWKPIIKAAIDNPKAIFVFKTGCGPDSDMDFMNDWGDIDYDIDLDRFNDSDIALYNSTPETNGVKVVSQTFYAGRDG